MKRFLFSLIGIFALALTLAPAAAQALNVNSHLEVKAVLKHKNSHQISLIHPRVQAREIFYPVHASQGAFAPEISAQAICALYHPDLVSVGFGTTNSQALAVKLNEQGSPVVLFKPRSLQASQAAGFFGSAAQVLSHVSCAPRP